MPEAPSMKPLGDREDHMLRVANYRCGIILFGFFVRSFLILTFFLYYSHAYAHDLWSNGKTVPEWVKKSCCGAEDVHHLRPDQIHDLGDYYAVDGYRRPIYKKAAHILPSQDGDYWIFYDDDKQGKQSMVYCFFLPLDF
jgi:Ni,Fe-hydrogenase I cytochrome b subunit